MENSNINDRIAVKNKEIEVENDPLRKREFQRELEILNLRRQIDALKYKIEQKQRG
jgi:hypothetical protein